MPYKALIVLCVALSLSPVFSAAVAPNNAFAAGPRAPFSSSPMLAAVRATSSPTTKGASLSESPQLVDVGQQVTFTLHAVQFIPNSKVAIRFLSPHHGYAGPMPWDVQCGCFRLAVSLAKRIHPLETARASAVITAGGSSTTVYSTFQIRGLAPGGRAYAVGGTPILTTWVGDPTPVATEFQHYCVWARTSDALGIPNLKVRLSVHFAQHTENWTAGTTGASGVLCVRRSIGHPAVGVPVHVVAYAGALQAETTFTPHS